VDSRRGWYVFVRPGGGGVSIVAVLTAVLAAVSAGADRWLLALGLVTVGAAAADTQAAFWLLVLATIAAAWMRHRVALITMLPGVVLLTDAALARGGVASTSVAVAAIATAAWGLRTVRQPPHLRTSDLVPGAIAIRLLLIPDVWPLAALDSHQLVVVARTARGVALALVVGAVVVGLGWLTGQVAPPHPEARQR
jgi:hypothetical protein